MEHVGSPVASPQSVAFHAGSLWVTSVKTQRIYEIDHRTFAESREIVPPGEPFGFAFKDGDLHAVLGFNSDADDRYVYRLSGGVFAEAFACPDLSGSFLSWDSDRWYLTQAHDKKLVTLDAEGKVLHIAPLDRRPVGLTRADGVLYVVTADDEWKNRECARVNAQTGATEIVATFPFQARGLGFDGECFWTTHREADELVSFRL